MTTTSTGTGNPGGAVLDLFRIDGRVAVVTGASGGLGAGFARALAEASADLVLAARRAEQLEETAAAVRSLGRRALAVPTDIADPEAAEALMRAAVDEFGRVDILVNNAGIASVAPATREAPEDFRRVIDVNLNGAYWAAQAAARVMRPGSAIVNIGSVLGLQKSVMPQAAYSASKAALLGLTRDLSAQWARRRGIRVNTLAPGFVETDMISGLEDGVLEKFLETCTLGRPATQRELDAALLFLVSPASSYVTGSTLAVDGGMSGH
ncbi:NAD(P)-dependent dehydrogenase (short-subunit alcohol dehydrogenase family) [Actinomadura hallensis]|uniref:NAD(P)-dependent dehydrogenase (Short-subunit alcohol dehydrogenase family) n=1 Tax=Actinomadura hallensis TaxID=337895 RepID=A0A543IGL4_9ACTN|nr:SDR family oxidoreductase [Actinomadura hallensis]TQM69722.1 NAD(P)-dependent dehydrogenase (short-subunit alcohol dehydrogenase family) [Actinomadura hallensis]HLU28254.1 SDR family oxidoreductase [Glycomyces sp.]